ncbi:MAG: TolC family protein [Myxococcota bacterium]
MSPRPWNRARPSRLVATMAGALLLTSAARAAEPAPLAEGAARTEPRAPAPSTGPSTGPSTTPSTTQPPTPTPIRTTAPSEPALAAPSDVGLAYRSAFALPVADRLDPYGPRPDGIPRLSREQIMRYALDNPLVRSAKQSVEAMEAQLRKAKWVWIPVIETITTLAPGANIECDDLNVDATYANGSLEPNFDFQWCRPSGDDDLDIQTVQGYFQQLARAGVRVAFDAKAVFPIFTFGKIRNTKRLARAGVALEKLEVLQVEQETILLVLQAHTALLLARESQTILRDSKEVVDQARARVEADLGGGGSDDWDAEPDAGNPDRDPNDLLELELAEIDVEQKMRAALRAEALARAALWDLAGTAAPKGFDVLEERLTPYMIEGGLRSEREYREIAIRERPEAHMARAGVEARRAQEKLARAAFLPDLGLAVGVGFAASNAVDRDMNRLYYQDNFNYSRVTAALAMRWRWDFHNTTFDLQRARAERRAQEYQREAAELFLGQDVSTAYHDVVEASHRIGLATRATALSWQLVVSLEQRDMVGGGDAEKLLRALTNWYKKRFEQAEAIHAHNEAVAKLARATGIPLLAPSTRPPSATPPPPPQDP